MTRSLWIITLSVLFLQAGGLLGCSASRTPTPAAGMIQFEVTVLHPTREVVPSATPTPTASRTALPTPAPTNTQLPSPTATPSATSTPAPPPQTSVSELATPAASQSMPTTIVPPPQPPLPFGGITLVELRDEIALPADVGRVEFKWVWDDKGCASPPEGQAFEIRIWPDLPGAVPLGVMDASQQDAIVCEPKSGTRIYEVGNLRGAPAISGVPGGRFRWHVALVELESQNLIAVSESRVFELPLANLPTPTPVPSQPRVAWPGQNAGVISLEQPQDNHSLPESTGQFEFKWRWSLSDACQLPPAGYGFELRIWPDHPDFGPLGAMGDARLSQADIFCDPASGLFGYLVPDLKKTPAAQAAGAGRFRWDVVLVQLDPYQSVLASASRVFELAGQSKLE